MLREIRLCANAKINLSLDVVGLREDGYHLLDMVNRSVDLCDVLTIAPSSTRQTIVRSNVPFLPRDDRNLALRAARILADVIGFSLPPLNFFIKKRIPTQAGLGGGSADAAAVLVGLNDMLSLRLTQETLCHIAEKVGADVPFCVVGGAARVRGVGEQIAPVEDCCDYVVVIAMPNRGRSTKEVFAAFDAGSVCRHPDTEALLSRMWDGDTSGMSMFLCNVFCETDAKSMSQLLIASLLSYGALGASMSGTGSAIFGIFSNSLDASRCCAALTAQNVRTYAVRPAAQGVGIL